MEKSKGFEKEWVNQLHKFSVTAKAVIVRKDGKVLLLKRSKKEKTYKDSFDLPGGHVEKGEDIESALKREIKEETGLTPKEFTIIKVSEFPKDHELFDKIKALRFLGKVDDEKVTLNKEHRSHYWLDIDKAIEKIKGSDGFEKEKKETLEIAKQYLEMKNSEENWKRALADFENFKKRTEKSNSEFRKFCLEGFVLELLPVLDNFEMAISHVPEGQEGNSWVTGIEHIRNQLLKALEDQGVKEVPVEIGDEVNEQIHHVVSGKAKKGKGNVMKVLKKGYKIEEKIIRPANIEAN